MRWLIAFLLMSGMANAEPATTINVVPDMADFTTSGSTTSSSTRGCTAGEYCTGNATAGGGTYTSNFNVPLTDDEVRRGFTINSAVTVDSHQSNSVLATCTSITQSTDCRDIFELGVVLSEGSTVRATFLHRVELDFSGSRNYTFTDTVSENSFGVLTGSFSVFGVDAGYHSGFYGPKFTEPSLTFGYDYQVEQQIIDQILDTETQIATSPPVEVTLPPPATESPPSTTTEPPPPPAAASSEPEPPPPPVVSTIAPIAPVVSSSEGTSEEVNVEAVVEAEIEAAPASSATESRQEKVKAAAEKVVAKIAPSQRYSANSQTTTMIAMSMIAAPLVSTVAITDTPGFFPTTSLTDNRSMANPLQNYTLFGRSNGVHDRLIDSQWSR